MDIAQIVQAGTAVLTVVLTAVLAWATWRYMQLTGKLVEENRALREEAQRPQIALSLRPHEGFVNIIWLIVENVGGGPAFGIQLEVKSAPKNDELAKHLAIGLFERGLSYLGPHQRLEVFAANAIGNLQELKQAPLELQVAYRDSIGRSATKQYSLDFGELEGFMQLGKPPLYEIEDHLKSIKESLRRLESGSGMLKVLAYSPAELRREQRTDRLWFELMELSDQERDALLAEAKKRREH